MPAPPSASAPGATLSKAAAPPAAATPAQRPAPVTRVAAPIVPSIKTVDKVLIFSAAVASLAAVGIVVWVFLTLKDTVANTPT